MDSMNPLEIRERRSEAPNLRDRDFADQNNISEAALVAKGFAKSECGQMRCKGTCHATHQINAAKGELD